MAIAAALAALLALAAVRLARERHLAGIRAAWGKPVRRHEGQVCHNPSLHRREGMIPRRLLLVPALIVSVAPIGAQTPAPANRVEAGTINGASFYIEIPAQWNKGLVMYTHGYTIAGTRPPAQDSPRMKAFRDTFLSRGFAFAASDYSGQGWAVKEAIEDTEALRRHFTFKYGAPSETYITGHSMGGHITMAIIERYPDVYQGAMPMCGPLGAAIDFLNTGAFDMLVTFEALFPGSIGSPYEPTMETSTRVKAAAAADPARAARYAQRFGRTVEQLPGALGLFHAVIGEVKVRAGGEPFDNRNRIYMGFGDDVALNRTVKRYTASAAAREYVRQYATPTGRISDPMLTIHTTSDNLVLGNDVTAYELPAAIAGTSDRFVARFIEANGHCNFAPAQVGAAFDALLGWARDGKRPAAGEQK
jgi:pimeloyl-ACP methyl ester carboxylesterase